MVALPTRVSDILARVRYGLGAPGGSLLGRTHPSALYRRIRAQPRWVNTHRELDTRSASFYRLYEFFVHRVPRRA